MKFIFSCCLLFSTLTWAQNLVLTAVGDPWPVLLNPDSADQGLISELVRTSLMDQGYDLRVDFMPWSRAMVTIKKNRADLLIGAWYAEERNQYLLYSEPIFSSAIKFIKHIDSPFEYTGIKSLSGLRVGTILGYQYDADFVKANNFKKIHADNLIINIYNLLARRISLTLDDQYVLAHTLDEKIPNWRGKIALVSQPLSEKRIYLAMNRSHPHCLKIIAAFNKGLAAIKKNGRYDEIVQSYEL